ncbi:MAG: hypothetical protein ACK4PR_01505 [Gammaproteobacteria bacterium]
MQRLTAILLEKWWLTVLLIVGFYFVPYLSWLSIILAALFTLAHDLRISWIILVALIAPNIVTNALDKHAVSWLIPANLAFVWFAAWILRRFQNWSDVFNMAIAMIIVLIPFIYLLHPDIQTTWFSFWQWLLNITSVSITQVNSQLSAAGVHMPIWNWWLAAVDYLKLVHADTFLPKISTGLLTIGYILGNLVNLGIARAWYLKYQTDKTMAVELRDIKLHIGATLALALVLVCQNDWLPYRWDVLCALLVLFFLAGLSLAHWLANWRGKAWIWLILLYLMLTIFPVTMSLFLVVLAVVDSIVNVRKRLMKEVIHDGSHPARKNS